MSDIVNVFRIGATGNYSQLWIVLIYQAYSLYRRSFQSMKRLKFVLERLSRRWPCCTLMFYNLVMCYLLLVEEYTGSCEDDNEPSASIQRREFLDKLTLV